MKMYIKPAIEIEMVEMDSFIAESIGFDPGGEGGKSDDGGAQEIKEYLFD